MIVLIVIALKRIVVDIDYCCLCQFELLNIYMSVSIFNVMDCKLNSWSFAEMVFHSRVIGNLTQLAYQFQHKLCKIISISTLAT